MPVEQVPGFWDHLGAGFNKGLDYYREDKRNQEVDAQKKAGLMATLFESGAVDSSTLQGSLAGAGMKDTTVLPSKSERRKKVLDQGTAAVDALSDDERTELGFKTTTQKKQDTAAGNVADLEGTRASALLKFANGETLRDNESELVGLGSSQDREIKRLGTLDPYLGQVGERYVAGAMNQNQGRVPPGGAQAIADKAYSDYISSRATSGIPGLTAEQLQYTKSFFDRAVQNALITQTKLDIDKIAAGARATAAGNAGANQQANQTVQWFGKINGAVDTLRRAQNDLMRANPALAAALGDPNLAKMPMIAGTLERYKAMEEQIETFRTAQAQLGNNSIPPNLAELLGGADAVLKPTAGIAGGTGGAPQGLNTPDPITAAAEMLVKGTGNIVQLQQAVQSGNLTQQQYDAIVAKAQQMGAGKKK